MKIERTKNATRNIIYGVFLKIYQLLGPFILRTIFIYTLGMEYLGLNSLFTSILSVLNLAELGVGSALVFSMYKPIAEDDTEKICALMNLYKLYYRIIGAVILVIGLILVPFIPNLISGSVPEDVNIYVLYLMNLGATVLSYWLFAYKTCLFGAHQRNDMIAKVTIVSSTLQYIIQAIFLISISNYYLYLTITLAQTMVKYQDPQSGTWYQVTDQGARKGNYLESSATALFIYTLAKAINEGYIGNEYITPVQKAFDGMIREFTRLEEDGTYTLTHCCAVAGLGGNSGKYRDGSFEYYIGEPVIENDPKSVGAFILAAIEYERMN